MKILLWKILGAIFYAIFEAEENRSLKRGEAKKEFVIEKGMRFMDAQHIIPKRDEGIIPRVVEIIGEIIDLLVELLNLLGVFENRKSKK